MERTRGWRTAVLACAAAAGAIGGWTGGVRAQERVPPAVSFEPTAVDFGDQVVAQPSKPVRITVTNASDTDLYVNSVTLGGDNRDDFTLAGDRCTGTTIKPGKSCVVDVVLTARATGPRRGIVTFTDNGGVQTVALAANGINSAAVPPP